MVITAEQGDRFSVHDNKIEGCNIEVIKDELIVQAWRPANWPNGNYSVVKLTFSEIKCNCVITLDQTGIPEGGVEHLDEGWNKMYWEPLKAWLIDNA